MHFNADLQNIYWLIGPNNKHKMIIIISDCLHENKNQSVTPQGPLLNVYYFWSNKECL